MPELRVRAGVLTGSAAVDLGAEGEGMVLGDTVNTASRLQSIAAPGTVLVDDVTRRASEAAIAYEDAGEHQVKGRERPVRAWTALRVVAGAGGRMRSVGLEAPLAGRDAELATIVDAFEATDREGCARMVTVVGDAGTGKSRLLWEFFRHGRHRAGASLASGALPVLWRGRGVLGAGGDGPCAGRDHRGRGSRRGAPETHGGGGDVCPGRARAAVGGATACASARPGTADECRPCGSVQWLAAVLRTDGLARAGGARV